jgi:aspartyl aminopeptidase
MVGSLPFKSDEGSELVKLNILKLLNEKYGIVEEDFISSDLELVPATKAQDIGFDRSMIGGYGQDDRSCAYSCIEAILSCDSPSETAVVVLTDKEEVGSDGNTGMQSNFVQYFISDLADMEGLKGRDVLSKSKCLSADVNAAYDPTYLSNYEIANSSFINRGVVLTKYTGSGGKYGTSDASAEFTGEICRLFDNNNILWQSSELGKVDVGGGGTIAKYIANLNVDVIDIGVPVLSMHAPFEVISKIDLYMTYRSISAFLMS